MEEYNIGYFSSNVERKMKPGVRTLKQRMIAFELDREYYDGARENGYGGFNYDGRWKTLLPPIIARYGLTGESAVLDVGCKKGFFLRDLKACVEGITVKGVENHPYPVDNGLTDVRGDMQVADYEKLPFPDDSFDFVMAFSSIYMLNLRGVIRALREIQRVGKGRSYVTLGAYRSAEERELFMNWTLLGTTILHVDEWREVFSYTGYTGDYFFTTASALNLQWG